ncbi:MAG: SUMF1/EgtB/PvdO family nonheme iron enzyme, partial [Akkermansiaceae bacterium]
ADIGLVAARGQRTFVGTEGFVPPEGPGSAQADVYGLGKVLYEMGSGKDRLQFPELPDELPEETDRKRWLALNQIICDICEPRVSKRRIKTAAALADSLRRLQRGKRIRRRRNGMVLALVPFTALLLLSGWLMRDYIPWKSWIGQDNPVVQQPKPPEQPVQYGQIKLLSEPEGAEVYDAEGNFIDITPSAPIRMEAGEPYEFTFRMDGYRTETKRGIVPEDLSADDTQMVFHTLSIYAPPVEGEPWIDYLGIKYQPEDDHHVSSIFVSAAHWKRFENESGGKSPVATVVHSESGTKHNIVLVTPKQAQAYCTWQSEKAVVEGYLNEVQYISPRMAMGFQSPLVSPEAKQKKLKPFRCVVKNIPFARLEIHTIPEGADVLINGEYKEVTPIVPAERVKPGKTEISISMEGYRRVTKLIDLKDGAREKITIKLQRDNSVVFGEKWTNSLGMKFVPIDENLLVSIWETRVQDYEAYTKATKSAAPKHPGFRQGPTHPVLNVSREMAEKYCKWLTEHEHKLERISADSEYRLLTDWEWSLVAGLRDNPDDLPSLRELRNVVLFPWGTAWPPEKMDERVGNLADQAAAKAANVRRNRTLLNYNDGFEKTSPVGSFPPNKLGIYDLSGNAHEWVADNYKRTGNYGVLRGGGWNSYTKKHLYVSHRNVVPFDHASNLYGFRIALVRKIKKLSSEFESEPVDEESP